MYASAHLPILTEGGVDVKAGRQGSVIGYESFKATQTQAGRDVSSTESQFHVGLGGSSIGAILPLDVFVIPRVGIDYAIADHWTIGAGVDYALGNNIVVGAQYRYYDFGKERFDAPDDFSDRDQDVKLHALGVNFSYKF